MACVYLMQSSTAVLQCEVYKTTKAFCGIPKETTR